jgi:hypothetical protein
VVVSTAAASSDRGAEPPRRPTAGHSSDHDDAVIAPIARATVVDASANVPEPVEPSR